MTRMVAVALAGAVALTGCTGGGGNAPPAQAKVSGTVTLDGKPMAGGQVRFNVPAQPVSVVEVKDGAFSGDAFIGKARVDVVWEKEGPPNPTNPTSKMLVNSVSDKFSGPNSPFTADITPAGATDLKFEVKSARR